MDGFSRFFYECSVPKVLLLDADVALMEARRDVVIEISELEGTPSVECGISLEPCLPQGGWEHGSTWILEEQELRMLQKSLERSRMKETRCHATCLQTVAKAIEMQVNDVPLRLLEQSTGEGSILRVPTPEMLKMNVRTNRAPKGFLTIPNIASDLMKNVEKLLNLWYHVCNNAYLSMAAEYKKRHNQS